MSLGSHQDPQDIWLWSRALGCVDIKLRSGPGQTMQIQGSRSPCMPLRTYAIRETDMIVAATVPIQKAFPKAYVGGDRIRTSNQKRRDQGTGVSPMLDPEQVLLEECHF